MKHFNIGSKSIEEALNAAIAIVGDATHAAKTKVTDDDMAILFESYGNLFDLEDIVSTFLKVKDRIETYAKNHQEEYQLNCENGVKINIKGFTKTKTEWDADRLKVDAQVQPLELQCKAEFAQYFKTPTVAVNPVALGAAPAEIKTKYSVTKTVKDATIVTTRPVQTEV